MSKQAGLSATGTILLKQKWPQAVVTVLAHPPSLPAWWEAEAPTLRSESLGHPSLGQARALAVDCSVFSLFLLRAG